MRKFMLLGLLPSCLHFTGPTRVGETKFQASVRGLYTPDYLIEQVTLKAGEICERNNGDVEIWTTMVVGNTATVTFSCRNR